ncbi:ATP-binding cassette domain-containing protein [Sessilibacter sp. MAH4]
MQLLKNLMYESKRELIFALIMSAISAAIGILLINYLNQQIEGQNLISGNLEPNIVWYFLCLWLLLIVSGAVAQVKLMRFGQDIVYKLRVNVFSRMLNTEFIIKEKAGAHRLHAVLAKDIQTIAQAFNRAPMAFYNAFLIAASIAYLGYLSLIFLALTLVVVALGLVVDRFITKKMVKYLKQVRDYEDDLFACYNEVIYGAKELELDALRKQSLLDVDLKSAANNCKSAQKKSDLFWSLNLNWTVALVFLLLGAVVLFGGIVYQTLGLNLSLATVSSFVVTILFMRSPLTGLVEMIPAITNGVIAARKINQLELAPTPVENKVVNGVKSSTIDQSYTVKLPFKSITFSEITFNYGVFNNTVNSNHLNDRNLNHRHTNNHHLNNDYQFQLGPIDLSLHQGGCYFIVGGNGSGKSTFSKIITGIYPTSSGSVAIDGNFISAELLKEMFITVYADFYLFNKIKDYERKKPAIDYWLQELKLDHKVSVVDGRLSTTDLSTGQKKRLALLHVCVSDRPLVLLDEWAADQDPEFKHRFYTKILPQLQAQGKTIIAITHDDYYFYCADQVITLHNGIIESATSNVKRALINSVQTET